MSINLRAYQDYLKQLNNVLPRIVANVEPVKIKKRIKLISKTFKPKTKK